MSGWRWGARSLRRLQGIHPDLRAHMDAMLSLSPVDLTVIEGLRSKERQKRLVLSGASRTLHSRHLTGHAVDVAPLVNGRVPWNAPGAWYELAATAAAATDVTGVEVTWGGIWDRMASQLDTCDIAGEVLRYQKRYRAIHPGKWPLFDGPHIQLPRAVYP